MEDITNISGKAVVDSSVNFINDLIRPLLTRFVVAIVILLIGFVLGKLLGKFCQRILHEIGINVALKKATGFRINIEAGVGVFITYFVYFLTVVMALNQIGITTTVLNMIAAAVIIIIIISIVLAIKDFVPNVLSGIFIHKKGFIKVGDKVKAGNVKGNIIYLNLVETRVETRDGDIICIPNSLFLKQGYTKISKKKR